MNNWFDKETLYCPKCRRRWVLTSTTWITDLQHKLWIDWVIKEHKRTGCKNG